MPSSLVQILDYKGRSLLCNDDNTLSFSSEGHSFTLTAVEGSSICFSNENNQMLALKNNRVVLGSETPLLLEYFTDLNKCE